MSSKAEEQNGLFVLHDSTLIDAPIERCFGLSCSIALVQEELGMQPVSGRTRGLVRGGDIVRWEGWQLGLPQHHVSLISGFESPIFFQDTMKEGRFQHFQHDHHFRETPGGTLLSDDLRFSLPLGPAGRLVARHIMVPHIRKLMKSRFARIKRIAEGTGWAKYLAEDAAQIPA